MIQRHQPHPPGTFAPCSGCRREPKHIVIAGRSRGETTLNRSTDTGDRHALECCRCGRSTARHPHLDNAKGEWAAAFAHKRLPVAMVPQRRSVG